MAMAMATTGRRIEQPVWYDLHCHVLPGIDDGCKTPDESIRVLREAWKQGVRGMIATPHYYPRESIETFLKRRREAAARLGERMRSEDGPLPQLCLGAEAAYHSGLAFDEDLERICMGGSRYLLLEMPFSAWPPAVLRDVHTIIGRGITPIIAHVERYIGYQSASTAQELFEMNVLIQVNAEALPGWQGRGARKMIKQGKVDVLASDAHNMTSRPPNLGEITAQLEEKGRLSREIEQIRRRNQRVFEAARENGEMR